MEVDRDIIVFENVEKRYGSHVVLRDLNFRIRKGEKVSLIGPSGSGKTTILRILMTLETIQGGVITVDNEPLWHMRRNGGLITANEAHLHTMRRKIGMVFQHFNLFPHMTALENVARPLQLSLGTAKAVAEKQARDLLANVGLAEKANAYPAQMSGGQKQRVAIARALAMQPMVLLFDEVTSALDPELVEEVLNVLRDIGKSNDTTMLLVTHEMSFAREFSDRVFFFDGGRVVEQGPPEKIFSTPSEERTQAFLRKIIAAGMRIE